jgi:hypothetical protein
MWAGQGLIKSTILSVCPQWHHHHHLVNNRNLPYRVLLTWVLSKQAKIAPPQHPCGVQENTGATILLGLGRWGQQETWCCSIPGTHPVRHPGHQALNWLVTTPQVYNVISEQEHHPCRWRLTARCTRDLSDTHFSIKPLNKRKTTLNYVCMSPVDPGSSCLPDIQKQLNSDLGCYSPWMQLRDMITGYGIKECHSRPTQRTMGL